MHDIRMIRENPDAFDAALARRGKAPMSAAILEIDSARRSRISAAEAALAERNTASKAVGAAKAKGDEVEFERLRALVSEKKAEIAKLEEEAKAEDMRLNELLMGIDNLAMDDVPIGDDEDDNVEMHRWGSVRSFSFEPKEHYDVAAAAQGLDFEAAGKLSGSRFVVLKGAMIRLHRALGQFMLDTHIEDHGLTEMWTPVLVRDEAMTGTGQSVAGDTLEEADLPRRMTALSQCFRSEAGSAGRDTAGMLRQHQFEKVEMVSITLKEDSRDELDRMTGCAEAILKKLEIPYRTVVLATGDMGFGAQRTHDIEVWLPGQNTYREISSCSVCGDFQARRMKARVRRASGDLEFVHTLNGSGLAVGRALIAVVENYQQEDGSIAIPAVLQNYMGGNTQISADGSLSK